MGLIVKILQELINIAIYDADDKYTLMELEDIFESSCFKARNKRKNLGYVLKFGND